MKEEELIICAAKIVPPPDEQQRLRLEELVSSEKRERVNRFRFIEDRLRSLYGDVLVRWILVKQYGIPNSEIHYDKNEWGKPYLKDFPGLYFNISHSGDWVVCAVGNGEVGIDVEQMKPMDPKIADRFFSSKEQEDLNSLREEYAQSYFYDLWTLKESYLKYMGTGLSRPLNSFTFRVKEECIMLETEEDKKPFCRQYAIAQGYKLAVCCDINAFPDEVMFLSMPDLNISELGV